MNHANLFVQSAMVRMGRCQVPVLLFSHHSSLRGIATVTFLFIRTVMMEDTALLWAIQKECRLTIS